MHLNLTHDSLIGVGFILCALAAIPEEYRVFPDVIPILMLLGIGLYFQSIG